MIRRVLPSVVALLLVPILRAGAEETAGEWHVAR